MTLPQFSIGLGQGLYLDSNGRLRATPVPGQPSLSLTGGLPVDRAVIQSALSGLGKFLPHSGSPEVAAALVQLGVRNEAVEMLGKMAQIASVAAKFIPIASFVVGVVELSGLLDKGGSDRGLTQLIEAHFAELRKRDQTKNLIAHLDNSGTKQVAFRDRLATIKLAVQELGNPYLSPDDVSNRLQEIRTLRKDMKDLLIQLFGSQWQVTYEPEFYARYQARLAKHLVFGDGRPVSLRQDVHPFFDPRPFLPVTLFGLECYLTASKAMTPEFRTTGEFSDLGIFADELAKKASEMRDKCLARTFYREGDLFFLDSWADSLGQQLSIFPGIPVGAYDLAEYTDQYVEEPLVPGLVWSGSRAATMNFHWTPPAGTPKGAIVLGGAAWMLSKEEAEAANQQSQRDYANLLVTSGYMNLVHLAATLRFLQTEPSASETVNGGVHQRRSLVNTETVEVSSGPIPLQQPITAEGRREWFALQSSAVISTQPLRSQNPIEYRVYLRALALRQTYEDAYWTSYAPVPDPQQQLQSARLVVHTNEVPAASKGHLVTHATPHQPIHRSDQVTLEADVFDYLIPTGGPSPYLDDIDQAIYAFNGLGLGGKTIMSSGPAPNPMVPASLPVMKKTGMPLSDVLEPEVLDSLTSAVANHIPEGERRNVQRSTITIDYQVAWLANRLTIVLRNRPLENRNYIVYLVVEEKLKSGQYLHTAWEIWMLSQFTFVPKAFFDREKKARKWADGLFSEFERRYAKSQDAGPLDPVIGGIRPGLRSLVELNRLMQVAEQRQPELLRAVIADALPYELEEQPVLVRS